MSAALTPNDAAEVARRGRKLLRRGLITHHEFAVLDAALWSAGRRAGEAAFTATYTALARLAGCARSTVAGAVAKLELLGLWQRVRRRVRVGWASRQIANGYRFCTESALRPAYQRIQEILLPEVPLAAAKAAQEALARRRLAVFSGLMNGGGSGRK